MTAHECDDWRDGECSRCQPATAPTDLTAAIMAHSPKGYFLAQDGHRECYCGHILADDETLTAHLTDALAPIIRAERAAALDRYADWCMDEVSVWDERVYPNRWDKARDRARHARARAEAERRADS